MTSTTPPLDRERQDLIETLRAHRGFLRVTVQGLTDDQARLRPTASALCLGGLVKHVARTEAQWVRFITDGPEGMAAAAGDQGTWASAFVMEEGETLAGILAEYDAVAARTDELAATLPDLDADQPLPEAPWFPPGARRSARRVLVHIVAETAQHAGHADILRESIDGAKTMG